MLLTQVKICATITLTSNLKGEFFILTYKILISAFALVLAVVLTTGCGESASENSANDTTTTTTTTAATTTTAEQVETPEEATTTAEPETEEPTPTTTTEATTSEPETAATTKTTTTTEAITSEPETTTAEVPDDEKYFTVEECLAKIIKENFDKEILNISESETGSIRIATTDGDYISLMMDKDLYHSGEKVNIDNFTYYDIDGVAITIIYK